MTDWSFSPIFDSYAVVALVTAALAALLLLGPNFGQISRPRRAALAGLRLLVIGLIALTMLRPTCVRTTTRSERSTLLVLLDASRSMELPHESGTRSRWQAQRDALTAALPQLRELSDRVDVRLFTYDRELQPLSFDSNGLGLADRPNGVLTDIGSALSGAVRQELGKRLAGVLLLGDGVQTAYEPPVELYEAGREIERLGYPLFTVVFGPPAAAAQARDVAVENLPDQFTVFVKNEVLIRGTVRIQGYVNQDVPVELVIENSTGKQQTLGPQPIVAREDGQQIPVSFTYVPTEPGEYRLTLRAAAQAGELVTRNNLLTSYLHVLEGGLRVLYLEGELRHEQRFLTRSLDASPDIALDFQWIDHRQRDRWPVRMRDVLENPRFDVLILGDIDSAALGEANLKWITEAVQRGKGLLMLGGYHSFGPGGYRDTPLADVLPIRMDRFERQEFGQPPRADLHLPGPLTLVPLREHAVLRLAPGAENAARWNSLPPLDGANKFVEVKDAPGVQVLAESPQHAPLLVAGEYGRGRVLAFAGDSTWRWAMRGRQAEHKRFWRQVALWLARRDESEQHDVWIKLAQRRFPPGSRVRFEAGAKTAAGEPIANATLEATLTSPDGSSTSLRLTQDKQQWSGQSEALRTPGDYRIELRATADGKLLGTARAEFHVFDQDIELATAAADHDQMARLAEMTREFGGKVVPPEGIPELLREIQAQSQELEVPVQTRWQLADGALDAWLVFLGLLAILSCEWTLRKRWGLV